MKILIAPYGQDLKNLYLQRMAEAIKLAFDRVEIKPLGIYRNFFRNRDADVVWLNWFENFAKRSQLKQLLIKVIKLLTLKVLGMRIVSTFHNRQQHDTEGTLIERLGFYLTFRFSDCIIILSDESRGIISECIGKSSARKCVLVPHPSYDCLPKQYPEQPEQFRILFFGLLRPYKNIELVIEMAKQFPDISFTIAGEPTNETYEQLLKEKTTGVKNITLIPHFLSEEEIDNLIDGHTLLLLPYNIKSSLNSGVVIHGLCKRINVIVPEIGTVKQLRNKEDVFSYKYEKPEEHSKALAKTIQEAYNLYTNDYPEFVNRITRLNQEMNNYQSPERISTYIKRAFE